MVLDFLANTKGRPIDGIGRRGGRVGFRLAFGFSNGKGPEDF